MTANINPDQKLVPTILDRLIDDDPDGATNLDPMRNYGVQAMLAALKRDLEALLNSRRRVVSVPREFPETDHSLVNYGLTDITNSGSKTSAAHNDLCHMLTSTLARFEPRLTSVVVTLRENTDALDQTLRFRIEAMLNIEPAPELVQFDSFVEPLTANIRVQEANDV